MMMKSKMQGVRKKHLKHVGSSAKTKQRFWKQLFRLLYFRQVYAIGLPDAVDVMGSEVAEHVNGM